MQTAEIAEKLKAVFDKRPEILFCFLFGSSAAGSASPRDVDLAVFAVVRAADRVNWMAGALFQARVWHEGIDFKEKRKMLMGV